jgi:hypothetical protein
MDHCLVQANLRGWELEGHSGTDLLGHFINKLLTIMISEQCSGMEECVIQIDLI